MNHGRIARGSDLVPAEGGASVLRADRVVDDERLVVPEVAVDEPVHQPIAERLQLLRRVELGNALSAERVADGINELRGRDLDRSGESAVGRRRPVDVELPLEQARRVDVEGHEVVGRARGRRRGAVEVRRQHADLLSRAENDHSRGISREHRGAVERIGAALDLAVGPEHVERHVVGVGPDADLSVVGEKGLARLELVLPVLAGRIVRGRDREALVEGAVREIRQRELRGDPAIGLPVVADERIAVVLKLAGAAEAVPEGVAGKRAQDHVAGLVVDRRDVVDVLEVMVGADVAFRVGRDRPEAVDRGVVVVGRAVELHERLGLREAELPLRDRVRGGPNEAVALLRHALVRDLPQHAALRRPVGPVVGEPGRLAVPRGRAHGRRRARAVRGGGRREKGRHPDEDRDPPRRRPRHARLHSVEPREKTSLCIAGGRRREIGPWADAARRLAARAPKHPLRSVRKVQPERLRQEDRHLPACHRAVRAEVPATASDVIPAA